MKIAEKLIASKYGMSDLRSGGHVLRDEREWRVNEKQIEYSWIVLISQYFHGQAGVFTVKFNSNPFLIHQNPGELLRGIFIYNGKNINHIHGRFFNETEDPIISGLGYKLFEPDNSLTLDGVVYHFMARAGNKESFMQLTNPRSESWRVWEEEVWRIGKELAPGSGVKEMLVFFEK